MAKDNIQQKGDLSCCDTEALEWIGAVQHFACLIALDAGWKVRQVSSNTRDIIGVPPEQLLDRPLDQHVDGATMQLLRESIEGLDPSIQIARLFGLHPFGGGRAFDMALHRQTDRILIEIEPALEAPNKSMADLIQPHVEQVRGDRTLTEIAEAAADAVRKMTGFDRVLVYRFAEDASGEVIAESRDGALPSFLGHRFPAQDIPAQARALYARNLLRIIPDVDARIAPLRPEGAPPIDLSAAVSRAVSPVHLEYLSNMQVKASMSISILDGDKLWGLIACHHRTPHHVDFRRRSAAELFAQYVGAAISLHKERQNREQLSRAQEQYERLVALIEEAHDYQTALEPLAGAIDSVIKIDGVALFDGTTYQLFGVTPTAGECTTLALELKARGEPLIAQSAALAKDFPGLVDPGRAVGGVLALAMRGDPPGYNMLFRSEVSVTELWAGAPEEKAEAEGRISPRKSFATWRHTVRGRSHTWTPEDLRAAEVLRVALVEFARAQAETALRRSEERYRTLALFDPLTGLPNRTLVRDRFASAAAQTDRSGDRMGVILADVDRFKQINDALGHPAGDALLQELARRVQGVLRRDDTFARLSGDEFVAILPHAGDVARLKAVTRRLKRAVQQPFVLDGTEIRPSMSMGVAVYPADGRAFNELLNRADIALYRAKRAERGSFAFFEPEMEAEAQALRRSEEELRLALQRGELELVYQPQLDLGGGGVTTVEALVRWRHPERGVLLPGAFVPMAEATGLIHDLGAWVMTQACRQLARWRDAGLPLRVGLNISTIEARRDGILQTLDRAFAADGITGEMVELEITESLLIDHRHDATRSLLEGLRDRGITLAIDDFGTGYSALSYLKDLPCGKLKIDRSFIATMDRPDGRVLVEAIVGLGRKLGKAVVAEGVETARQLEALRQSGCTAAQGYLIARPMPPSDVPRCIARLQAGQDLRAARR
ncbi:bifunctional diguanylate cyclase/phosphodiesterase [Pseudoroseicyclus aestuarii]|uniref:Diguanylate cyclase (GGDEF)-like protein n=1 Tax=Pseudoroseicyclus aestuarii TaxID=1795041 RepID=A0A318T5W3_9RHOB|nr:EAL domain-containing protein [Pseudoroseicyclus aestuarii]PYE83758.1 diguanylate cyclase (GGDEF)-like protein [Pseudoroseicyclus aestuarii]